MESFGKGWDKMRRTQLAIVVTSIAMIASQSLKGPFNLSEISVLLLFAHVTLIGGPGILGRATGAVQRVNRIGLILFFGIALPIMCHVFTLGLTSIGLASFSLIFTTVSVIRSHRRQLARTMEIHEMIRAKSIQTLARESSIESFATPYSKFVVSGADNLPKAS